MRSALKKIEGVKDVETDTRKRIAKIVFEDTKTGLKAFLDALKQERFDAQQIDKSAVLELKGGKSCN